MIIFAGTLVAVAYAAVLHFFASELFLRPVLAHVNQYLPDDFEAIAHGVPLRWKLLGALPIINVITGVVVSGLSTREQASLEDLGLDVLVAVVVAFTLSFELTAARDQVGARPGRRPAQGHGAREERRSLDARSGRLGRRDG